ncbi:MAG: hypothetical protein FIA95_04000, partial [Gemmatimonadetes bacterium]|nr:hypothetical protein [Gemmatimonadota bacterium]
MQHDDEGEAVDVGKERYRAGIVGTVRASMGTGTAALTRLARPGPAFALLFAFAFGVRAFVVTKLPQDAIRPDTRWEAQAIAVSLAERGTFGDPYALPTGPTAHLPPIPPALTALCYRVFGVSLAGGYAEWLVEAATEAALWGMLPWVSAALGLGIGAGTLAGLAGALVPRWGGHGEALAAVAIGLLMVACLRAWAPGRRRGASSLLLGLGAGAAFHVQPAILPVVLGWMAVGHVWGERERRNLHTALTALGIVAACLPWGWRNYHELGAVFFVRDNLGLELRMGNHEGADAAMEVMDRRGGHVHPRALESEARMVQQLGEVAYMRNAGREAAAWITGNPIEFVRLTASRAAQWWLGPFYYPPGALLVTALTVLALAGLWRAYPALGPLQRGVLLTPLLAFPLIYYLVAYMPRYRQPVDWIFLLLAAAAVTRPGRGAAAATATTRTSPTGCAAWSWCGGSGGRPTPGSCGLRPMRTRSAAAHRPVLHARHGSMASKRRTAGTTQQLARQAGSRGYPMSSSANDLAPYGESGTTYAAQFWRCFLHFEQGPLTMSASHPLRPLGTLLLAAAFAACSGDGPSSSSPDIVAPSFAAVPEPFSLGDRVWEDTDGDSIQDAGEPGLVGVTLTVTNPDYDPITVTTGADGLYTVPDLWEGTWKVCVTGAVPDGYVQTYDLTEPMTDGCATATLGPSRTDVDFGYTPPRFSLGDFVWKDTNGDGVQDAGEVGLAN